ncbi:hypothetical protein BOTBODRAFT_56781 [Botryobasidium botryosum FD-172 SS1]|uniref:Zn(2)-C6 fungal-type domain-containing protein n=1 Tax=Botryobasidium botryosum (strain FD-172 SS1) TaxID=930990 RepID=A0A067MLR0_BOTB1|nr:hypothetical protein BOTBODRAFT_56781 [Botryobasidium botryosum FD-172 SS1]
MSTTQGAKKTRRRPRVSCVECTRRRQKCDRQQPCSLCVSRGVSHLCRWESGPVARPAPARPPTQTPDHAAATIQELNSRLANLERALAHSKERSSSTADSPPSGGSSPRSRGSPEPDNDTVPSSPLQKDVQDAAITLAQLSLANHGEYVGSGSIVCALYKLGNPENILFHYAKSTDGTTTHPSEPLPLALPQNPLTASLRALVAGLPPRSVCDELVNNFFLYQQWCLGISKKWFMTVYDQMWRTMDNDFDGPNKINSHWLTLLFSIFALSVMPPVEAFAASEYYAQSEQYFLHALAARRLAEDSLCTGAPSLSTAMEGTALGCLGAIFISRYMCNRGNLSEAWKLIGSAVRNGLAIGLHRDPGWSKWEVMNSEEKSLRITTWWLLFTSDKLYSYVLGRPSMIPYSGHDVPLPATTLPDGSPDIDGTYFNLNGTLSEIVGKTGDKCHGLQPAAYATVLEMDRRFEEWEANLPAWFSWRSPNTVYDTKYPNLPFQRLTLGTWFLACRMSLHRPFLTQATPPVLPPLPGLNTPGKVVLNPSCEKCIDLAIELVRMQHKARMELPLERLLTFVSTFFVFDAAVTLLGALRQHPTHERVGECKQEAESAYEMLETARAYGTGEIASQAVTVLRLLRKTEWQDAQRAPQAQPPPSHPPTAAPSSLPSLSPASSSAYQTPSPSHSGPLTPPASHLASEFPSGAGVSPGPQSQQPQQYDLSPGAGHGHGHGHGHTQSAPLIPFLAASNVVPSHQRGYDSAYAIKPSALSHDPYSDYAPSRATNSVALPDPAYTGGYGDGTGGGGYGYGADIASGGLDFGLMTFEMLQGVDVENVQWRGEWGNSFFTHPASV